MKRIAGLQWAMSALLLVGITVSSIALVSHYRSDKTSFCDFGDNFNCDMVNRGPYATFATTAPLVFPSDPSQPPAPWLERAGDAFAAHVVDPLNALALRIGISVPVAALGLGGYVVLLALTWIGWTRHPIAVAQFALAGVALLFSLYLTYVEKYIIAYWCILCLTSLAVIVLVTVLSGIRAARPAKRLPRSHAISA